MQSLRRIFHWCLITTGTLPATALATRAPAAEAAGRRDSLLAYIGTYTGSKSRGIYWTRFDPATGRLTTPELAAEAANPTFLAVHPNRRWLYAANEMNNFAGERVGALSAFSVDHAAGRLTLLNQQPSGGSGPCHLAVDESGRCLLAANYGSGSVASFRVGEDGRLGGPVVSIQHLGSSIDPQRQTGPHAHQIVPDPANRFALACDLGLDQVLAYRLRPAQALLSLNEPPAANVKPGSGPRHLAFHPNGRLAYVINELNSTLTTFAYSPRSGLLKELTTVSTLPPHFSGKSTCAEVQVHPSGKYVYGSNRGDDSIAIFTVDKKNGIAAYAGRQATGGKTPRHFTLDPAGRWLLAENQGSDNIVVFRVDRETGQLSPAGSSVEVPSPVCLVWVSPR